MANDNKYIPALRFPEFQNDGEWGLASVGIYYKVQGGFAFKSGEFKDSGIPIVRISNIPNDGNYVDTNNCVYYDRIPNEKNFLIAKGDLLIAMSGATTGKTAVYNKDNEAYLNQRVGLFKSTNSQNYYPFICQWVKTELFQNQLKRTLAAGAQPNISSKDIESFTLIYPTSDNSSNEQKKIADCLSSLDSYIDATKRKLEQLKEYKKCLMQRLFPAEGKTVPELRFHEFMEKEWEIDKFSNVFTCIPNNTLSRADLNYSGGRVKNIHYGDILTRFRECLDVRRSRLPFISENNDVERYFMSLLKNGDLIIADTAEDEIVGKCAELQGISDEFVVAGLHTIAIRPNNKFANCYLAFYMNSSAYRKQLTPLMQGVKVLSISRSAISKTEIYFPSSILEQEKIAKCLDSLENLIESYERKIEVLNIQKKGLMQKLFPRL